MYVSERHRKGQWHTYVGKCMSNPWWVVGVGVGWDFSTHVTPWPMAVDFRKWSAWLKGHVGRTSEAGNLTDELLSELLACARWVLFHVITGVWGCMKQGEYKGPSRCFTEPDWDWLRGGRLDGKNHHLDQQVIRWWTGNAVGWWCGVEASRQHCNQKWNSTVYKIKCNLITLTL